MVILLSAVLTWLTLLSTLVYAQDSFIEIEKPVGLVRHANIAVIDEVQDGCWTNSSAIEAKLRLMFEQNNIAVSDEPLVFTNHFAVYVAIYGLGFREENGRCVSLAELSVRGVTNAHYGGAEEQPRFVARSVVSIFSHRSIFTSSPNNNDEFLGFFETAATEYLADVLAGRRNDTVQDFFSVYPDFGAKAMTSSEFQRLIEAFGNQSKSKE